MLYGSSRENAGVQYFPDINLHLAAVAAEEPMLSAPQLDVIREVIYLRRRIDSNKHFAKFRSLLCGGGDDLLDSFSTRWLVSIADTFADHGSGLERSNAMIVVVLTNMTKLAETERLILNDTSVDPPRLAKFTTPGTPLWDGMTSYGLAYGDMPQNMWTRIRVLMAETPVLSFIFEIVFARLVANDTLIGRLAALNPRFC
jgi:hypothetical protein